MTKKMEYNELRVDFASAFASASNYSKYDHMLEVARDDLRKLDSETRVNVIQQFIRIRNYHDFDLYHLRNMACGISVSVDREGSKNCVAAATAFPFDKSKVKRSERNNFKPCNKGKRSVRNNIKPCKNSPVTVLPDHTSEAEASVARKPLIIRFKLNSDESIVSKPATCSLNRDYGDEIRKSSADECKMGQKSEKVGSKRPRSDRHYGDEEKVRIKKMMNKTASVVQPELPPEFKQHIENLKGTEVTFVIEKPLYTTDVSTNHGRLSVPLSKIDNGFLRQEEKELLATKIGNRMSPIEAKLIDPSGKECDISLRKWDMTKKSGTVNSIYNLMTGWNNVVKNNSLCEGMIVQLWSFRVGSTLWFALVKVLN